MSEETRPSSPRGAFWLAPLFLIGFVFAVTFLFSRHLEPLLLVVPLLGAYYGFIGVCLWRYGRSAPRGDALLKREEFRATLRGLTPWMLLWVVAYPLAAGTLSFVTSSPPVPWGWLALGVPFGLVNGPLEELFWRLYLDRAGKDAGVGERTRLWYASAVFSVWHFVFVVFLFPPKLVAPALAMVLASTFVAGLLWMRVYQRTRNILPNIASHAVLNVLMIWPAAAAVVLGVSPVLRMV